MLAWRLCRRPHADLSGDGAQIFGGRWNSPGRPVVYLAEHPALAALEVRVHLDLPLELVPDDYVLMRIGIRDALIAEAPLADNTAEAGNEWLRRSASAALRVPSVLMPQAWNILLNPLHPDAVQAHVDAIEPFRFDPRLWYPLGRETPLRPA